MAISYFVESDSIDTTPDNDKYIRNATIIRAGNAGTLQRAGSPEEYAEAILFLAAGAGYISGQTLTVDGGLSI